MMAVTTGTEVGGKVHAHSPLTFPSKCSSHAARYIILKSDGQIRTRLVEPSVSLIYIAKLSTASVRNKSAILSGRC